MQKFTTYFIIVGLLSINSVAQASLGVALSSGQGIREITPYRFSLSWDFGSVWKTDGVWGLNALLESSYAIWNSPTRPDLAADRPTDLTATTFGPLFRWQRQQPLSGINGTPYVELGVGLSWLSETQIQGRILSLHFQFEDKGGMGLRFGKKQEYDLAVRVYHYSNASIKRPNSGVNLAMVSFGIWFID